MDSMKVARHSFAVSTIITTDPNELMEPLHNRMPDSEARRL
jgi:putative SOS response-associated peptidase YedK